MTMSTIRRPVSNPRSIRPFSKRLRAGAAAIALVVAASPGAYPDDKGRDDGKPRVLVLFDGKSLDGWKKADPGDGGAVKVEGGALIMAEGRLMNGITTTRRDLPTTDYELIYEARRLSGSDFFAAATFAVGKSFITFVNGGWGGNVTGLSSLNGSDASENETTTFVKYEEKTWYRFRVRVTDEVIRCWVDDKEVVAVNHQGVEVDTRIEVRDNQPLGFATYESAGALRRIELRKLTPDEVATTNKLPEKP
jgi:hypothetical protein